MYNSLIPYPPLSRIIFPTIFHILFHAIIQIPKKNKKIFHFINYDIEIKNNHIIVIINFLSELIILTNGL